MKIFTKWSAKSPHWQLVPSSHQLSNHTVSCHSRFGASPHIFGKSQALVGTNNGVKFAGMCGHTSVAAPPSLKNGTTRKRSCRAGRVWIRNFLARWPEMKSSTQKNEMFDHMEKAPHHLAPASSLWWSSISRSSAARKRAYKTDETSDWLQFGGIAVWRPGAV